MNRSDEVARESPWGLVLDELRLWAEWYSPAAECLGDAAVELAASWLHGDGYLAPAEVEAVVLARRRDPSQKAMLVRLIALERLARSACFASAVQIEQNLEMGLTWTEMSKALGRSRQSVHRQFEPLVRRLGSGDREELADLANWLERPRSRSADRSVMPLAHP